MCDCTGAQFDGEQLRKKRRLGIGDVDMRGFGGLYSYTYLSRERGEYRGYDSHTRLMDVDAVSFVFNHKIHASSQPSCGIGRVADHCLDVTFKLGARMLILILFYRLKLATAGRLLSSLSPFLPFRVSIVCSNASPVNSKRSSPTATS